MAQPAMQCKDLLCRINGVNIVKKLTTILLSVLLIASLFVSCDNATKAVQDELVEVTLSTQAGSRSLTVSNPLEALSDVAWTYTARKVSEKQFNYGESPKDDNGDYIAQEITLFATSEKPKTTLTLSQGKWKFELFGRSKDENRTLLYHGKTDEVLILKSSGLNQITVEVSPYTDALGQISFKNVKLDRHDDEDISPNYLYVTGPNDYSDADTTFNGTKDLTGLKAGQYTVTVAWKETMTGDNPATPTVEASTNEWDLVIASETIVVTVYGGRTTEISGNISEETGSAKIEGEYKIGDKEAVISKEIKQDSPLVIVSSVVAVDDNDSSAKTTVTFPVGSFTTESVGTTSSAELTVKVNTLSDGFTIVSPDKSVSNAVANIDLSVKVNGAETSTTQFNGQNITVETYILKNLTNVKVYYDRGTGSQENIAINSYDPTTGKLVFTTTHFSRFDVWSDAVCYNVNSNEGFTSLGEAVNKAASDSVVSLIADINVTEPILINTDKKVEINLNGKNIIGKGSRALWVKAGDVSITGTGTISSTEGIAANSSVIRVADSSSNGVEAKLTIGSNVVVSSDYSYAITVFGLNKGTLVVDGTIRSKDVPAISGNGGDSFNETYITINGSVETINENAIYHPQAGILTINGTVTGKGGIEAKSGNIIINSNGKVIANSDAVSHEKNSDGCSTQGYAIAAVNNDGYKSNVLVEIKYGAEISGKVALKHDSESLSEGKSKAIIHSNQYYYFLPNIETNSTWVMFDSDSFYTLMEKWDGYKAESYSTPVDTNNKIVTIASAEELALFAFEVNNGNSYQGYTVNLTNNIDLSGKLWTPIGKSGKPFAGRFDGNSNTIYNLLVYGTTANNSSNNYHGLFGNLADPAIITKFTLENVDVSGSLYVGAVAGMAYTGKEISDVTVKGDVKISGYWYVGGIAGNGYINTVKNCKVEANAGSLVSGTGSYIGGIYGFRGEGNQKIESCVSNINVTGYSYVGGISGMLHYGNTIFNCTSSGTVTKTAPGDTDDLSDLYGIGGIAGIYTNGKLATIENCNFTGELISNSKTVNGGIIGHSRDGVAYGNLRIINCKFKDNIVNVNIPTSTT